MNKTEHYQLNQWEKTDRIQMEDFNEDNAKIEAAFAEQEAALAQEAAARAAADTNLQSSMAAAIAAAGNCKIATGTYVGTGKYGSGNRNTLAFDGTPIAVIVAGTRGFTALRGATGTSSFGSTGGEPYAMNLIWGANSLSWYGDNNAYSQCNDSGATYYYCALFATT